MSRAEITRISFPRIVKTTNSPRLRSVCPSAYNLNSSAQCSRSLRTTKGLLKNTSSHSESETRCFVQFLPELPASQSKPTHSVNGFIVYASYIRFEIESP